MKDRFWSGISVAVLTVFLLVLLLGATENYRGSQREHFDRVVSNPFGDADTLLVIGTSCDTSDVIAVGRDHYVGIWYQVTLLGGSASDIKIEPMASYTDDVSTLALLDPIESSVTSTAPQAGYVVFPCMRYFAIRITGNAANDTCSVKMKPITQS